ncbi:hypothetical protein C900_01497 [Fulvivirga imtechensis AK7]|uniref:Transmembrane protein n=2 Tax=Fulvivirga TaxID=396811 RepID=L8JZ82_9BACT|nr:hypothetical protein C900_01497 [Fulvivirga imtechensis AK7]
MLLISAQISPSNEYKVKAVFLFNFVQFVEWPSKAFAEKDSPLVIGILGENPFGTYLHETVYHEKLTGHPLVVKQYENVKEVSNCQILFVNPDNIGELGSIAEELKQQHVLIVGEATEAFMKRGGMIGFFLQDGRIRMKINLESIKEADLKVSSKLLRVADMYNNKQ